MELQHKELTEKIIGAAIEVHKTLGNGFLEYIYQEALSYELKRQNIVFEVQKDIDIWYKDLSIPKKYTPDLIVENKIIVELKAEKNLTDIDEAQLLNYLKASKFRLGLLINFGKNKLQIKRRIL